MNTHGIARRAGPILACLLLALALAPAASAQHAKPTRIGVVDVDEVIARSRTISEAVRKAESSLKERKDQIDAKMDQMQQARADLDRRRSVLSEDQVREEEDKILRQRDAIDDLQHETNKELARIREQVMPPEVDRILAGVREVARREGFDLILPAESVLFHSDQADITPLVIQWLDKQAAATPPKPQLPPAGKKDDK